MRVGKKALYAVLSCADRLLQILIPVERNRICYISKPDYEDNAYYLYRDLIETRSGIEHIWLVESEGISNRIVDDFTRFTQIAKSANNKIRVQRKRSVSGYFLFITSQYVFHTHGGYAFSSWAYKRKIFSLWHGMPIKCIGALNTITPRGFLPYGTVYTATSAFFKYVLASAFDEKVERVKLLGQPRCDVLCFHSNLKSGAKVIKEKLNIPLEQKMVAWLPTYRSEVAGEAVPSTDRIRSFLDDVPSEQLDILKREAEINNCSVIVKLHPKDPLNHISYSINQTNIKVIGAVEWFQLGIPLYDFLSVSDGLISDVSSVLLDFGITSRPIGLLGFNEETYTRGLIFPIDILEKSRRFQSMRDQAAIENFFKAVNLQTDCSVVEGDIFNLFYDKKTHKSCEAIKQEMAAGPRATMASKVDKSYAP